VLVKGNFTSQTRLTTAQQGKPVSGGQQRRRIHGDTELQEHAPSPGSNFAPSIGKSLRKWRVHPFHCRCNTEYTTFLC